jgi:hypothetical protein
MSKCAQEGALSRKSESHQRREDITMQKKANGKIHENGIIA